MKHAPTPHSMTPRVCCDHSACHFRVPTYRSEKKVLNDINHRSEEGSIKHHVLEPNPKKGTSGKRIKERISEGHEKVFILVRQDA